MAIEPKLINVYIAATEELTMEYQELTDLLSHLNKKIFPMRNIKLNLVKHNANMGEVKDCELCLSLYWTKFGDYSQAELREAYKELQGGRNPRKLYVFFKDSEEITPELQTFKDSFATDFGHFFCHFENVDTMKLHFFLQLEAYQNNIQEKLLKVKNQKVLIEGEEIVDLNKVPFAAMNREFCQMRDEITERVNNIAQFEAVLATMENPAIRAMLNDNYTKLNKLQEEFDNIQNVILNTAIRVAKLKGEKYDDLLQRAIELFESGNLNGAHSLLKEVKIKVIQEREAYKLKKESLKLDRDNLIKRISQLTFDAEAVLGSSEYSADERIKEAYEAYNQALLTAKEVDYDKEKLASLMFDFAYFTQKYNLFSDAIRLYEEVLSIYETLSEKDQNVYMPYVAAMLNNLAILYNDTNRYEQAEQSYLQALSIRETLSEQNPNVYIPEVAMTLNNLAVLYFATNRYEQAEQSYLRALSIRETLSEKGTNAYMSDVAMTLNNLAVLYKDTNRSEQAEQSFLQALSIRETLSERDPNVYMFDVAMTLNNLAILYKNTNRSEQAEQSYLRAFSISETLSEKDPNIYMPDLAMTLNNLANLYKATNRYEQAEQSYLRALSIRETLSEQTPNVYMSDVAMTLNNLAVLYSATNRSEQAEQSYFRALSIYETLSEQNPNVYMPDVAMTLNNLAVLYIATNRSEQAEQSYLRALSIRETLSERDPNVYMSCVAMTLNNLGILNETGTENMQRAEMYYAKAANIYSQLYIKFGEQFIERYINTLNNLLDVFDATAQTEKATEIREMLKNKIKRNY